MGNSIRKATDINDGFNSTTGVISAKLQHFMDDTGQFNDALLSHNASLLNPTLLMEDDVCSITIESVYVLKNSLYNPVINQNPMNIENTTRKIQVIKKMFTDEEEFARLGHS
ncbi:uncharacterized protein LOC119690024 isoform X2 [Teleopsis dalmanni]|uniref:uncharacterized protein LOC119690024 isoform X2 n=1 Tax=Teleopsis dalmanni TaxID=139649 RepID=UPI0018CFCCBC|nr:uncharacterized protein LOC119690024 isoform X2 [Teleopsis dalmanni]